MLDDRPEVIGLLTNIRAALPRLEALKAECDGHWGTEDGVYRFYHHSFKVYDRLQPITVSIVASLQQLAPDRPLNPSFLQIVGEGTDKSFSIEHNRRWLAETRPILEAFFHAKYFLDVACRYGRDLAAAPTMMPSGWATGCFCYRLR